MAANTQLLAQILVIGGRILFVMIILVLLLVISKRKELKPECQKGFLNGFMIYLGVNLFQRIFNSAVTLIINYLAEIPGNDFRFLPDFLVLIVIDFINFSIYFVSLIILFYYIELYLFHTKTEMRSFYLTCALRLLTYIISIILLIVTYFTLKRRIGYMDYIRYLLVGGIFSNSFTILIGFIFIMLFISTTKEKPETRKYSILLSIGIVLIFILPSLISIGISILNYIDNKAAYEAEFYFFYNSQYTTIIGILNISYSALYGIGLIIFAIGAYKTMKVPLSFAKIKRKEIRTEKILENNYLVTDPFKKED